jgi:hypothetical protein
MRRSDLRPWARKLPTFVLRIILIAMIPVFIFKTAWDGGIKEGIDSWLYEWKWLGE